MNIELPENFARYDRKGNKEVYLSDGILKMKNTVRFKSLMKELAFDLKGRRCFYCGKSEQSYKITKNNNTIDHIIPQEVGGPTITNNLLPACCNCNRQKNNMNLIQYVRYLKKPVWERKAYIKEVNKENEMFKSDKEFSFLNGWVTEIETDKIKGYVENGYNPNLSGSPTDKGKRKSKYSKIEDFYHKYGRLKKSIIIDRNNRLLSGFTSLMFAKKNHLKTVPVIKIDNVEIFY